MGYNLLLIFFFLPILFACTSSALPPDTNDHTTKPDLPRKNHPFPPGTAITYQENGTIRYLKLPNSSSQKFDPSPQQTEPGEIALNFIEFHHLTFKLKSPRHELHLLQEQTDNLGITHIRFAQRYKNLPIWSSELNVHLNRQNKVYLIQGTYIPTPELSTRPHLDKNQAIRAALLSEEYPESTKPLQPVELVIHPLPETEPALAYKVYLPGTLFFVDAINGSIREQLSTRHERSPIFLKDLR